VRTPRQPLGRQGVTQRAEPVRKAADGRVEGAVGSDLPHADEANCRARVHHPHQLGEGALEDLGVRIQEEDIPGIAGHHPAVVRVPEAEVSRPHHASARKLRGNELGRLVTRIVVDDDDVRAHVADAGEDRAQTWPQPLGLVGRDRDDREVVHAGL
jgi:hypothetical protein